MADERTWDGFEYLVSEHPWWRGVFAVRFFPRAAIEALGRPPHVDRDRAPISVLVRGREPFEVVRRARPEIEVPGYTIADYEAQAVELVRRHHG
jgi:hypothetical protein